MREVIKIKKHPNFNKEDGWQNKPRGQPETKVDNAELKAIVEADPSQTTSKIAAGCDVSDETVLIHLKQFGKVKNLERWIPHELSAANR
ncbi:hypothetical protein K1T71_000400 [Dendrolimus kikuchii]|uniref:Uncharacterized protein n=1 Tax=Dendrolimus kikuchii TaxID=765133 RepID=A0ACC1DJ94_9NEOP|nr:hypothetical protein K1T71_000400 [Dendrolimus kikuchii]